MKSNLIYKSPVNQKKLFRFRENSKNTVHKEIQQYFLYHYECDTKFLYFPHIVGLFLNIIMF